jgi:hypothetical protein
MFLPIPSALDGGKGFITPGPVGWTAHERKRAVVFGDGATSIRPPGVIVSPEPGNVTSPEPRDVIAGLPIADILTRQPSPQTAAVPPRVVSGVGRSSFVSVLSPREITVRVLDDAETEIYAPVTSREPKGIIH